MVELLSLNSIFNGLIPLFVLNHFEMKCKYKIVLIIHLITIILPSCILYPNIIDVPLIKEKNDLRIDAGASLAATAHATVSYGLTKKIAVQGFSSIGVDKVHYLQGAVGYFKNMNNKFIMELYTGFGSGYGDASKSSKPGDLVGNYHLGFAQIDFGKANTRIAHLDYGIAFKAGFLRTNLNDRNYYDIYSTEENFDNYIYPKLIDNSFLFQPTAFARIGGEKLKLGLNVSSVWIYKFTNRNKILPVNNFNFGLSINYNINVNKRNAHLN